MSPDDREYRSDRGFDDRGLDRGLERQLTDAGRHARLTGGAGRADPVFAAELRERLVASLESEPPSRWPLAFAQRVARVVPVAVAAVVFGAAVVGASRLHLREPDATPPVAATDNPDASPGQTSGPEPSDDLPFIIPVVTPSPSVDGTPKPTPAPTPKPATPAPDPTSKPPSGPVAMSLSLKPCDGGVVIGWSKYAGEGFNHYTTLRNTTADVPMAYPPQGGAVDFGGTYTTDLYTTSAEDSSGSPFTTYYYRAMAFNSANGVIGASAVGSAQMKPTLGLGPLSVAPDAGGTRFTWTPYGGPGACFTYYKLVASTTNPSPSYLAGDPYLWAGSWQGESTVVSPDLSSGQTYYLRLQVIRSTALGAFVAAETDVTTYIVP